MKTNVDQTLEGRNDVYGDFNETARIAQNIKRALRDSPNWDKLDDTKKEALEMDATKTARILNGDPEHHDGWHDKIGYLRLVERQLEPTLFSGNGQSTDFIPPKPLRAEDCQ